MIKEICPKGHYYDAEKYPQCPHCQKEAEDRQREQTEEQNLKHPEQKVSVVNEIETENRKEKTEDRGFFGWIRKNGKNIQQSEEPKTQKMIKEENIAYQKENKIAEDKTEDKSEIIENKEEKKSQESEKKSLQSLVNEVNREDELRTIGMWGTSIEPVVGWLVCITGKSIGEAYRLKAGKNHVGRDIRMDVVISNDAKVSREKHMTIMYEPEARKFYLISAESEGMCYVNDNIVLNNLELKKDDIIKIGETKLWFVPLCGENFTWDEWIEK